MELDLKDGNRALHWVLKIGNLETSLNFFDDILGLRVLRHEEFDSGCEATCNGPYGGAWSKTMIGYGPESSNFALELTYNYGIDGYEFGNGLLYIAIQQPAALKRIQNTKYQITGTDIIEGPDNYRYKILPWISSRAERFVAIAIRVNDLDNAKKYYLEVLGMQEFLPNPYLHSEYPNCLVGFNSEQTLLQLIKVQDGQKVNHSLSGGRIAFACPSVYPIFDSVIKHGDIVQVNPLTLPTPGKADVVVTILIDRDAYEICFVEDIAFYQLAEPKYDLVDFIERASRGGDGKPLLKLSSSLSPWTDGSLITTISSLEDLYTCGNQYAVLYFNATWCKKCDSIKPFISSLAKQFEEKARFFSIDLTDSPDISDRFSVTSVPHFIVLVSSSLVTVASLTGSDTDQIRHLLEDSIH